MEKETMNAIQARLKGYSVIPLRGGAIGSEDYKKPLIPWQQFQKRLASVQEIRNWNTTTYGIATGPISNLFVLDRDFLDENASEGFTVRTGRGFSHHYFRWDSRLDNKVTTRTGIKPSTDVRGEGGYVVAWNLMLPPVSQLPAVPQWLVDLLPNKNTDTSDKTQTNNWLAEALNDLRDGNRNDTFTRIVGSLRSRGYSSEFIQDILLPKAKEVGFPEDELAAIIKSVERYPVAPRPENSAPGQNIETFLSDKETVDWICEPIVANKSIGFVAGLQETGKTWILIDLAVEAARGQGCWLGKFPVKQSRVLFIDQERFKGETQRRFAAVIKGKNIKPSELRENLFIRCGTTTRLDLTPSFEAFRKELADIKPDLVIVDSFVTFHTREENNRKDIQEVLERIKQLRSEFGCTFIFIDHENKGVFQERDNGEEPSAIRMAGSIAKPAAAEFVLTVRKTAENESMVYHTKSTLARSAAPFSTKIVDLDESKSAIRVEAF